MHFKKTEKYIDISSLQSQNTKTAYFWFRLYVAIYK